MFIANKKSRFKKKLIQLQIPLEEGLETLWKEDPMDLKVFLELILAFNQDEKVREAQFVAQKACDYFSLRVEPFEQLGHLLEQQHLGGEEYYALAREKSKFQKTALDIASGRLLNEVSSHLKSHQLLQSLIRCEEFCSPQLAKELLAHPQVPELLLFILSQNSDYALRRNPWPLIHSINFLRTWGEESSCFAFVQLLDHPDNFVVEEAKNALYWILTENPERLNWLIATFEKVEHGTVKLQLLDLLRAFGDQEECSSYLHKILINFKKNHDAKYSTQYAYILIQSLMMSADAGLILAARQFYKKNKSWFTDRSLEKLFDVIEQMEGKTL